MDNILVEIILLTGNIVIIKPYEVAEDFRLAHSQFLRKELELLKIGSRHCRNFLSIEETAALRGVGNPTGGPRHYILIHRRIRIEEIKLSIDYK